MADLPVPHRHSATRQRGFTLSELLVTLTIVGITASIGVPMLTKFLQDADVSTQADYVIGALNFTRSEAVKRNVRVTMCRSTDGTSCAAAAGGTADWRSGWIIFTDTGTLGTPDGTDAVLRVQGRIKGKAVLLGAGGVADYVSYSASGQPRLIDGTTQTGTFTACVTSIKVSRRQVALTAGTGWVGVSLLAGAATCN
ncbi:MAG: GspH/FimT family pseudopilin [Gammaproteobacteria bacterium]